MNVALSHRVMVLTPPGGGAIALIRVVGPDPAGLVAQCFRPSADRSGVLQENDRLRYGVLVSGDETIDDVIVCTHQLQGNPVVDISAHGGSRVVSRILETLESLGVSVIEKEQERFSVWATAHEIEREALEVLAAVKTERAVRFAAYQWQHLADALHSAVETMRSDREEGLQALRGIIDRAAPARVLLEGATVALVGPANSGKSTLFNAIVGASSALVSAERGTTRDWVSESVTIHGVPVELLDTAGAHADALGLERRAIRAGQDVGRSAAVRVLLLDGSAQVSDDDITLILELAGDPRTLIAWNKSDLPFRCEISELDGEIVRRLGDAPRLSAETGHGIDHLMEAVAKLLGVLDWDECRPALFSTRQLKIASDIIYSPESAATILGLLVGE